MANEAGGPIEMLTLHMLGSAIEGQKGKWEGQKGKKEIK
jgi:hypothetical protein